VSERDPWVLALSSGISVSNLAYAHPGGDLLFDGVSFRLAPGRHAGLIGTNGVGKSTLMRILVGELEALEGTVAQAGPAAYMPQEIDAGRGTVRELLLSVAPDRVREVGLAMVRAERELEAGDDAAGVRLGEAIGSWSNLGGYELEGRWDAACRRSLGAGLAAVGDRPADTLSGGERKRVVLDLLFSSEAQVLLLDEPDNFLDVPAKRELEAQIRATRKTVLVISHDRELLNSAATRSSPSRARAPGFTAARTPRTRPRASTARS
jgi:ATPase subunit of ABC transporter with duplicated ATPase domains